VNEFQLQSLGDIDVNFVAHMAAGDTVEVNDQADVEIFRFIAPRPMTLYLMSDNSLVTSDGETLFEPNYFHVGEFALHGHRRELRRAYGCRR
jgi:hypothetical protein